MRILVVSVFAVLGLSGCLSAGRQLDAGPVYNTTSTLPLASVRDCYVGGAGATASLFADGEKVFLADNPTGFVVLHTVPEGTKIEAFGLKLRWKSFADACVDGQYKG